MGSVSDVNLLDYLRSKTQVDVDTLDVDGIYHYLFSYSCGLELRQC